MWSVNRSATDGGIGTVRLPALVFGVFNSNSPLTSTAVLITRTGDTGRVNADATHPDQTALCATSPIPVAGCPCERYRAQLRLASADIGRDRQPSRASLSRLTS